MEKLYSVRMGKAVCAVDLGDGSERGEYVSQDYILNRLGRPHRSISLMYCYYPFDKQWPARISDVHYDENITYQWDYPYDDYFPYRGGIGGDRNSQPFEQMRDIRRHGQDVTLTLTIDPHATDEMLAAIGDDLRPFGRVFLRINHEATGNWFSFTKRASYQEIADFYCRAVRIIKERAPNVLHIICIGGIEDPDAVEMVLEKEFAQTVRDADIWSVDKYMALHWGWPYDIAESGGSTHHRFAVKGIFELTRKSFERFRFLCGGKSKPMVMSECNADGDVTGPYEQAEMLRLFCDMLRKEKADWFTGMTFYQFRDRGRLGLEIQDPNNADIGIEQPVMQAYREIINDEWFMPSMTIGDEIQLPAKMRWGSSEDAEGIAVKLTFDDEPHFCELIFDDDSNLMIELNGRWFYKSPKAKIIDLMPAFYDKPLGGAGELIMKIFAPPASGENDLSSDDGIFNYFYTLEKLPVIRIRTAPTEPSKD